MAEDLYRLLQVDPAADLELIRAAYRRLARAYHPDVNAQPWAAERMRAINAAYSVLSDPVRRAAYDARRYLGRPNTARSVAVEWARAAPAPAPTVVSPKPAAAGAPTRLQRSVDRAVAAVGVLLLVGLGFYTVNVIPYAARLQAQQGRASSLTGSAAPQAAAHPSDGRPSAGAVPARLSTDDTLRGFPGAVLVAPTGLEPFQSLPIVRVEGASRGIARYAVYYGNLTTGGATISGLIGRPALDNATPHINDCPPEASYCAGAVPGQPSGPPGLELFRAPDLVADFPAFVAHRVCCNGDFWSLSWYEPATDVTYTIDLSRSVAAGFGSPSATGETSAARAVAALAGRLVRVS